MENMEYEKALNTIKEAKTIALVPSKIAVVDSFAAAVGMYFALLDAGKDVYFVYPGVVPEAAAGLIEGDRIISNVKERELLVSIDYSGTNSAAAHYSTEDDVLQIKIGPVPHGFPVDQKVTAKLVGFDFDAVIVFGEPFDNLRESFGEAKVLNVDNTQRNEEFGDINLIDHSAASLSQHTFNLASKWQFPLGEKAAKALLTGMTSRIGLDNSTNS